MVGEIKTVFDAILKHLEVWAICSNVQCRHTRGLDLKKLAQFVGPYHSIVPKRGELHFSERLRCPKCRTRGSFLWANHQRPMDPAINNYGFTVKQLDANKRVNTLLFARDVDTATIAYDALLDKREGVKLSLQHGSRVIKENC
jgi:hypothetical protein